MFPEKEIVIEAEEDAASGPPDDQAQRYVLQREHPFALRTTTTLYRPVCLLRRLLREYEQHAADQRDGVQEELSADVLSAVERNIPAATRHFAEFAAAVSRAPQQVLAQAAPPQQNIALAGRMRRPTCNVMPFLSKVYVCCRSSDTVSTLRPPHCGLRKRQCLPLLTFLSASSAALHGSSSSRCMLLSGLPVLP